MADGPFRIRQYRNFAEGGPRGRPDSPSRIRARRWSRSMITV